MMGEINPSYNYTPMMRFLVADGTAAMQGVALTNVADTLFI